MYNAIRFQYFFWSITQLHRVESRGDVGRVDFVRAYRVSFDVCRLFKFAESAKERNAR